MKSGFNQRGEGEMGFVFTLIGLAVVISIGYFTLGFISSVKESRANLNMKKEKEAVPPKSFEEMGGYEVTYTGLFF